MHLLCNERSGVWQLDGRGMGATVQQKSKPCLTVSQMCISLHDSGVGSSVTSQQEGSCCHSQRCGKLLFAELNAEHRGLGLLN